MKRNLFLIISMFFIFSCARAQITENAGGGVDNRIISFGVVINYFSTESIIYRKDGWQEPFYDKLRNEFSTGRLKSLKSEPKSGVGLTAIVNFAAIPGLLDIRATPGILATQYAVRYDYLDGAERLRQRDLRFFGAELPFAARLRSTRYGNIRANFLAGFKYSINLQSNAKLDDSDLVPVARSLKYKTSFLAFEVGLGLEIYFQYFRMIPEIKLSYGLSNVIIHEDTPYSNPIIQIIPKAIVFAIHLQ